MCRVKIWFLLVILFLVIASSGCGGGSGGGSEGNYGYNGNNGGSSGGINGTWEIVSGYAVRSRDYSGKIETDHFTYAGKNEPVEIEMTQTYVYYVPRLKGKNVAMGRALTVFFTNDKSNYEREIMFTSGTFRYTGNGTYTMTPGDDFDGNGANDNLMNGEFIMKLEDENTMRWIEYAESNTNIDIGFSYTAYHYEIVLRRAGTNGGNTTNNNTNNYTDNNTTPNPPNTNNNNSNNTTPNTNTNIPPQISGTWRVTSGSGTATQTVSGNPFIGHLTYTPEIRTEIGLEITQNDYSTYAGDYVGMYSLTLTGDNVINSGTKGGGAFRVPYTVSEYPEKLYPVTFNGGKAFKYAGNGIYRMTKADIMGYNDNSQGYEYTLTLEDANTLRWQYFIPSDGMYELVLSKAQ